MPIYPTPIQQVYERDPRRRMAELLKQQGTSFDPVRTKTEAVARLGQAILGGLSERNLQKEYETQAGDYSKALASVLGAKDIAGMQQAVSGNQYLAQELGLPLKLKQLETEASRPVIGGGEAFGMPPGTVVQASPTKGVDVLYKPPEYTDPRYVEAQRKIYEFKEAPAREERLDRATERLAGDLQQAKVPQSRSSINTLNQTLGKYASEGKGVPGLGYLKGFKAANFFLTDEGKDVKSQSQAVANDLLNMYSGLAVTLPEGERRALEEMRGGTFSSEDFTRAWPHVVNRFNEIMGNIRGGFPEDVIKRYSARPTALKLEPISPAFGQPSLNGRTPLGSFEE